MGMHVRFLLPWCFFFSQCGGHRVSFRSEVQGLRPRGRRGRRAHRPPGRGASPGSASTPKAVEGATAHQHPHQRWSLSLQRGGLENCFRSGRYMRCPCFPPIRVLVFTSHVQPEERIRGLSVQSSALPFHVDWTRGRWFFPRQRRGKEGPAFSGESFAQVQSPLKERLGLCGPK